MIPFDSHVGRRHPTGKKRLRAPFKTWAGGTVHETAGGAWQDQYRSGSALGTTWGQGRGMEAGMHEGV